MNQGKVYIMRNPAFKDNILKVGKTTRTSEERAKELGKPTGVPDNFIVLHEQTFEDCDKAENDIHELLKPYRYRLNKEFFEVDLAIAVRFLDDLKIKELEEKIRILELKEETLREAIKEAPSKLYMDMLKDSLLKRPVNDEYTLNLWCKLPLSIKHFNMKDTSDQVKEQVAEYIENLDLTDEKELFLEILKDDNIYLPKTQIENMNFKQFSDNLTEILEYLVENNYEWYGKIIDDDAIIRYEKDIHNDFFNTTHLKIQKIHKENEFEFIEYMINFPLLEYIDFIGYGSNDIDIMQETIEKIKNLPNRIKILVFKIADVFQTESELDTTMKKLYNTFKTSDILTKSDQGSLFDIGKRLEMTIFLLFD